MNSLSSYLDAVLEAYLTENLAAPSANEFDLNHLKQMTDLVQIKAYTARTLQSCCMVGEGTARSVYRLPGGRVLKVAKNYNGLGQNEAEATVCKSDQNSDIFPITFEVGSGFAWLIAEEAQKMTRVKFAELTGVPWGEFMFAIVGAFPKAVSDQTEGQKRQYQQAFDKHYSNKLFRRVVNLIKECKYEPGDIAKLDSWGVINNRAVIIDSGFTEAVNKTHYQR